MTNTTKSTVSFRTDEATLRAEAEAMPARYGNLALGRFLPGTEATYAAFEVLRANLGAVQPFIVHTMLRIDDLGDDRTWSFVSGRYFDDLRSALAYLDRD